MALYDSLKVYAQKRWQDRPLEFWAWLQGANPASLQEMWDTCPNGSWMLKALYDELYPSVSLVPERLRALDLFMLDMPTRDGRTLRDELTDDWGENIVDDALNGAAYPSLPAGERPYKYLSRGLLYQLFVTCDVPLSWIRLYALLGYVRPYYNFTVTGQVDSDAFDKAFAGVLRENMPDQPFPWFVDATFDVRVYIDYPTDEPFDKHAPTGDKWFTSEPEPSELRYLAKEDDNPARSVWAEAVEVRYSAELSFAEFAEFAEQRRLIVRESHAPSEALHPTWYHSGAWSLPDWTFEDRGYYDPTVPSKRRVDVNMDVYVDTIPAGDPPVDYSIDDCRAMYDEFHDFVEENWSLRS